MTGVPMGGLEDDVDERRTRNALALPAILPFLIGLIPGAASIANGQVVSDGSLGVAGPVAGPAYDIPESLGRRVGDNLFHSFSEFNVQPGDAATFSGAESIRNVLARVTGGSPSRIDGTLSCTIAGANFYLVNPSGVVFGPNAFLDVSGSFAVTTADLIRLGNDGRFAASVDPGASVLTSSAPAAFGFLPGEVGPVDAETFATLSVPDGKVLSIVGGRVTLAGAQAVAADGRVNLVAVGASAAGAGGEAEVVFDAADPDSGVDVVPFAGLEAVELTAGSLVSANGPEPRGVVIRTGSLRVEDSGVSAEVSEFGGGGGTGGGKSGPIDIRATGAVRLLNGRVGSQTQTATGAGDIVLEADTLDLIGTSFLSALSDGLGRGGDVTVTARVVNLDGQDPVELAGLSTRSQSLLPDAGDAGSVTVNAGELRVVNGAVVSASTEGPGAGGNVTVDADVVTLDRQGAGLATGLLATSNAPEADGGDGGSVRVSAPQLLEIRNGASVSASTRGSGAGGDVEVDAGDIRITGSGPALFTGISARSTVTSASLVPGGRAGSVRLRADSLVLDSFGFITADTRGAGDAGVVDVDATSVAILGGSQVVTQTSGMGEGGALRLDVTSLVVADGGVLSSATSGPGGAGGIVINAVSIELDGGALDVFTGMSSDTQAAEGGDAGSVGLGSADRPVRTLRVAAGAGVRASTEGAGRGGDIRVFADAVEVVGLNSPSNRTAFIAETNASEDGGDSGDITFDVGTIRLRDGGDVSASTGGSGAAGDITVLADTVLLETGSTVSSAAEAMSTGPGGAIRIGTADRPAQRVSIASGAAVTASGEGTGRPGDVSLTSTGDVVIDGADAPGGLNAFTGIKAEAGGATLERGGSIRIDTGSLTVTGGGAVSAATNGPGDGGSVDIVGGQIEVAGAGSNVTASASPLSVGSGEGGDVSIGSDARPAGTLIVRDGAVISAATASTKAGGDVTVFAGVVDLRADGRIETASRAVAGGADAPLPTGEAGDIRATAAESVRLTDGGTIETSAENAGGGDVSIAAESPGGVIELTRARITARAFGDGGTVELKADERVHLIDSEITAEAGRRPTSGELNPAGGRGGNIFIDPQFVILDDSNLIARAGVGNGGDVRIETESFLASPGSDIDVSSDFGVAGTVDITSPDVDVAGGLVRLPGGLASAAARLQELCGQRVGGDVSSFVVTGRGGTPQEPGGWIPHLELSLPQPSDVVETDGAAETAAATRR